MLSSFPNPYPDEILYSTVARYHQRSGNILFRQTVEELFGDRSAHSAVVLPAGLGALAEQTEAYGLDFDCLLYEHTLYPYNTAFFNTKTAVEIYDWAKDSRPGSVNCQLGLYGSKILQPGHLRFCPECYAEELKQFGEGYWHRIHQTPGVLICERHHCPLLETTVPYLSKGSNTYTVAAPDKLFPAKYVSLPTPVARQQAIWIAEDIRYLYENYERIRTAFNKHNSGFQNLFLKLLQIQGLVSDGGMLRINAYRHRFLAYFDSDLLNKLGLSFDEQVGRPWIVSMCRGGKYNVHPLYFILMARFLCGGLARLVDLAEKYTPAELKFSVEPRKRVADHEQKLEVYRSRWLAACQQMPDAGQNEIRKTEGAAYTWLNRHDKEWLSQHPKERKPRGGNCTYADWAGRDSEYSKLIPEAAKRLRTQEGKPVQVTKTKLLQAIGCGMLPARELERLPMTEKAIAQAVEDRMAYRMRKMLWAEQELILSGEPVVKWRLMKTAGIRDEDWDVCWDMFMDRHCVMLEEGFVS